MRWLTTLFLSVILLSSTVGSQTPKTTTARLPVREVTVFKDGHAFVVHRGRAATEKDGNVVLDELPAPVLGTFWPFSADEGVKLRSVVAGPRQVTVERTASNVHELIEANVGANVIVTEDGHSYSARIEAVPTVRGEGGDPDRRGDVVLLRTADGVRAVTFARISEVTFKDEFRGVLGRKETRDRLTLRLDWDGGKPAAEAEVGMMYLQKGLRWIPGYRITLDGAGKAEVELQGTLVNELTDLEGATVNLVVGVPRFAFEDTLDPMALQKAGAALSPYFQKASQTAYALSNAIMTQAARMTEVRPGAAAGAPEPGRGELEGARNEDLFVYTVDKVTLAKGERLVVRIASFAIPYDDVYQLSVPIAPPPEVWRHFNNPQQADLARILNSPKVMHVVRLSNESRYPLTTAPALLLHQGRVLAQSMMTYTAIGAVSDLDVTTAVDVRATKEEDESGRVPQAMRWRGEDYMRVELAGKICLTNFAKRKIRVEVVRHVLGEIVSSDHDGRRSRRQVEELSARELGGGGEGPLPNWWAWYSWPWWWRHLNGVGRITWDVELEPGGSVELSYAWHYFWR